MLWCSGFHRSKEYKEPLIISISDVMYKQVIAIRTDLKMGKGKIAAQVAHASLEAYKRTGFLSKRKWDKSGHKKIVVKVSGVKQLMEVHRKAVQAGLTSCIIMDAGRTQIEQGTTTAVGIGPDEEEKIDKITKNLKLLG